MLIKRLALICLTSFSATTVLFSNRAIAQNVNQEMRGVADGPETFVDMTNFTVNPTGNLNQKIDCEARNNTPVDPRCDGRNIAIYGSQGKHHGGNTNNNNNNNNNNGGSTPDINQNVSNGGTNTTVITPNTSNSNSSNNTNVRNTVNSTNTNSSNSAGGAGGNANANSNASVGNISTGGTSVSPSTRVKVDGDRYNNIQFGSQAPGTGSEAFSFQYRSACGASVAYRQGFALKPKRFGGGGLGFALDISSTDMDTIDSRSGVQKKMDSAFAAALGVVNSQQEFENRLNSGVVSLAEAQTRATANCAPVNTPVVRTVESERKVYIDREIPEKPRTCTARGCN